MKLTKTYIGHNGQLFVTIPSSRDINSYPDALKRLWGKLTESPSALGITTIPKDTDCVAHLNAKAYYSAKANSTLLVPYTTKEDKFSTVPVEVMNQLGHLTIKEQSIAIRTESIIQEILTSGYYLQKLIKVSIRETV